MMSIGAFAELSGLTASALRFYDDAGVLRPEQVDPVTGYRYYTDSQRTRASRLRQLRDIGMSLPTIGQFFIASPEQAVRLIDEQVAKVAAEAVVVRETAARLVESLDDSSCLTLCVLSGPMLAAAVDQVLATTIRDSEIPILAGVRLEVDPDSISLTATDRYRLAVRTLVPSQPYSASWAGTLSGDDLRNATSRLRRSPTVTLESSARRLALRTADGALVHCRVLSEVFPDYKGMISSLSAVTHRVTTDTCQFLEALERAPGKIGLTISAGRASVLLPDAALALDGTATGADLTLWFELTTLYPALSQALGNDVMLDLRGADQPTTVRSADSGDLTTLVMPCLSDSS